MIKVMTIFGTRPEAIKMCPVVKELEKNKKIESIVCVTAQHREMLDQVLEIFNVIPDYDLDIMKDRQTITGVTTRVLKGLEEIIKKEKPNIILVHGDTTTTFAGSLAAFYNKVDIGHVEAGLRTNNKYEPYPEEMNRCLTGVLADLNFAPTENAKNNLLNENKDEKSIFVTGNTVIDVLNTTINDKEYVFKEEKLNQINYDEKRIITMTAHRRENLGKPLEEICDAVNEITKDYEDIEFVYAVHLNPKVRDVVFKKLGENKKVHLVDPIDLKDMHNLMNKSYFVMTDSGGLQEEVPSMGKPVLVLRNVTERPEGIEAGTLKLAGNKRKKIVKLAKQLIEDKSEYEKMAIAKNPFGDGKASIRIVEIIEKRYKNN